MNKSLREQLVVRVLILVCAFAMTANFSFANEDEALEIYCAKDKWINYSDINYLDYTHYKPTVHGYGHQIYGPWIEKHLNCYEGHIKVTYKVKDHYGKWHYCYTKLKVKNDYHQSSLSYDCPHDEWVSCDDMHYHQYKKPKVHGYGHHDLYGPWLEKHLNSCGIGHIKVSYKIVDECGKEHWCWYTVKVKGHDGYGHSPVKYWPQDFVTDACNSSLDPDHLSDHYGTPHLNKGGSCTKLGVTYKDEIFYPVSSTDHYGQYQKPEFCYKILRKWSVIDWCSFDGYGAGYSQKGRWDHVQTIKVIGGVAPDIECPEDVTVSVAGNESTAYVKLAEATGELEDGSCSDKLHISNDSKFADDHGADASGHYPFGSHWVTFKAKDGCLNDAKCKVKITVKDNHAPTPYCHSWLVGSIGWHDDGVYTDIDPRKFDAGSYDNITPNHKLKFRAEPARLTCEDLDTNEIKIYVQDEFGNENVCTTYLILQDNIGMCPQDTTPESFEIAGSIMTEADMPVSGAVVTFDGDKMVSTVSSSEGIFSAMLPQETTYSIKPAKDVHYMDGVNTKDYILLFNYVAGNTTLDSPYKMIAADVDGSGVIDAMDIFALGSIILNRGQDMGEEMKSWRFVDAHYRFPDPSNPFVEEFPQQQSVANLSSTMKGMDFVGVKIGDIDGSISSQIIGLRSANTLQINIQNEIATELVISNPQDFLGASFSLQLDRSASIVAVHPSVQIVRLDDRLEVLWNNAESISKSFVAVEFDHAVSDNVKLIDGDRALSIDTEFAEGQVELLNQGVAGEIVQSGLRVEQNRPNPFTSNTNIVFELDAQQEVSFRLFDMNGKLIQAQDNQYQAGRHQIEVNGDLLTLGGIYYYSIETSQDKAIRKMVFID